MPAETTPAIFSEDEQAIDRDSRAIVAWFKGWIPFVQTAKMLESKARQTADAARLMEEPASDQDDVELQRFVKQALVDKKEIETHWGICQVVSGVHRRLTAKRKIATDFIEEAINIGNRHHSRFVAERDRRIREDAERERAENERRAQEQRERELAQAELEAVRLEEGSPELSLREEAFCAFYIGGSRTAGNAQAAAAAAGFRDALKSAARLISLPKIQAAIKAKQEAARIREQAAAVRQSPLAVESPKVTHMIARAPGTSDRAYESAELLDETKLIGAIIQGGHGIPWDVLTVSRPKLNEYARSLHERINTWPGVRHVKDTRIR